MARTAAHHIGIVIFDGVKLLDIAGPSEVFSEANRMGAHYELTLCAVGGNPVSSSAGITIPVELEDDHGEELARQVAQSLVVFLQRPGGQSQFSPTLSGPRPRTSTLRSVLDAVAADPADPAGDHSTPKLVALAAMSPRHLTRLFHEELGTTPTKYVESVRFDGAKAALELSYTVAEAQSGSATGAPTAARS